MKTVEGGLNPDFSRKKQKENFFKKINRSVEEIEVLGIGKVKVLDMTPEVEKGIPVFLAPGTPWNFELSKELLYEIYSSGRRVVTLEHPDVGRKGNKDISYQRKNILEGVFKEKNLEEKGVVVLAHSFGASDLIKKGPVGVKGVVLMNPIGFHQNEPLIHYLRALKGLLKPLFSGSKGKKHAKAMIKSFVLQSPWTSIREVLGAGRSELEEGLVGFAESEPPLVFVESSGDEIIPPKKRKGWPKTSFVDLGEGDHSSTFHDPGQMKFLLKIIDFIERKIKDKKES